MYPGWAPWHWSIFGTKYKLEMDITPTDCITKHFLSCSKCNIHHEPLISFWSRINSASRSMSSAFILSICSTIAFLALSSLSASSFSIDALNSGTPPLLSSSESGLEVWNGTGRRLAFGNGVGGWLVRMVRNDWKGSLKTISSYCQECTGPWAIAWSIGGTSLSTVRFQGWSFKWW